MSTTQVETGWITRANYGIWIETLGDDDKELGIQRAYLRVSGWKGTNGGQPFVCLESGYLDDSEDLDDVASPEFDPDIAAIINLPFPAAAALLVGLGRMLHGQGMLAGAMAKLKEVC